MRRLLDAAVVHHDDQVGQRHRLFLAVGDVDEGDAERRLQLLQLGAHADLQERVERRQRLVEQQRFRIGDQRAGQRHALLLAAGKLRRPARRIGLHLHQLQHVERLGAALVLVDALHLQAEGDVVDEVEMRKQRVGLEHHRRAALGRRQVGDDRRCRAGYRPIETLSWPAIMRSVEVLPQPDGPSRQQ